MQFYFAEEPASPLDFDNDEEDIYRDLRDIHAEDSPTSASAAKAKSMAPAISRAGAFRERRGRGSISSEYRPSRMSIRRCIYGKRRKRALRIRM